MTFVIGLYDSPVDLHADPDDLHGDLAFALCDHPGDPLFDLGGPHVGPLYFLGDLPAFLPCFLADFRVSLKHDLFYLLFDPAYARLDHEGRPMLLWKGSRSTKVTPRGE